MQLKVSTYIFGTSPVHNADARVKIILLAAYSVTLFLVNTWVGITACCVLLAVVMALSRIRSQRFFSILIPVYVLMALAILCNSFVWDATTLVNAPGGVGAVSSGVFADSPAVVLVGSFGFLPAGFARGCFYAARIILLVLGSLVLCYTTSSTALIEALSGFFRPLRRLHVPADDVATTLSIALRFIPVVAEELGRIRDAQWARGASFGEGSPVARIRAWATALIPLLVGMFRRANTLAVAMDARCYGAAHTRRTSLCKREFTVQSVVVLVAGLIVCAVLSFLL